MKHQTGSNPHISAKRNGVRFIESALVLWQHRFREGPLARAAAGEADDGVEGLRRAPANHADQAVGVQRHAARFARRQRPLRWIGGGPGVARGA